MRKRSKQLKPFFAGLIMIPIMMAVLFSVLTFFTPPTIKFPTVLAIYSDFIGSFSDQSVRNAILSTGEYVLISSVVSIFCGVLLSFLLNVNKRVWKVAEPFIDFLRSIPITFFIPAFAVILGVSSPTIVWLLAVIPSTLIILVNVSYGIREQNISRLHHYQLLSGKKSATSSFFKVTVYEVLPAFISGFKIALSYSIVIVTVLEYMQMGNQIGLGGLVYDEMEHLNYKRVYSIIMMVGLIGYAFNLVIDKLFTKYYSNYDLL
jgi:ABC-type nitrate/sulfonate/bicarbonate transport system permease component